MIYGPLNWSDNPQTCFLSYSTFIVICWAFCYLPFLLLRLSFTGVSVACSLSSRCVVVWTLRCRVTLDNLQNTWSPVFIRALPLLQSSSRKLLTAGGFFWKKMYIVDVEFLNIISHFWAYCSKKFICLYCVGWRLKSLDFNLNS